MTNNRGNLSSYNCQIIIDYESQHKFRLEYFVILSVFVECLLETDICAKNYLTYPEIYDVSLPAYPGVLGFPS